MLIESTSISLFSRSTWSKAKAKMIIYASARNFTEPQFPLKKFNNLSKPISLNADFLKINSAFIKSYISLKTSQSFNLVSNLVHTVPLFNVSQILTDTSLLHNKMITPASISTAHLLHSQIISLSSVWKNILNISTFVTASRICKIENHGGKLSLS